MATAKRTPMRMREMRPNSVETSSVTARPLKATRAPANPMVAFSDLLLRPGSLRGSGDLIERALSALSSCWRGNSASLAASARPRRG
jgi:hypothetical protein